MLTAEPVPTKGIKGPGNTMIPQTPRPIPKLGTWYTCLCVSQDQPERQNHFLLALHTNAHQGSVTGTDPLQLGDWLDCLYRAVAATPSPGGRNRGREHGCQVKRARTGCPPPGWTGQFSWPPTCMSSGEAGAPCHGTCEALSKLGENPGKVKQWWAWPPLLEPGDPA